jgi:hypothetical protein
MKDKIKNIILNTDILGYSPSMYVENDNRLKTVLGGSFTMFWVACVLFSLFFFGQELWEKLKPITNSSSLFDDNPATVNYYEDFEFFFGITDVNDGNKFFIDNSIYKASAYLDYLEEGASALKKIPLSIVPCRNDSFDESNKELFDKYAIDGTWCLEKFQNISLSGVYGKPGFKMIEMNLEMCVNTTEESNCKSADIISSYIDGAYLSFFAIQNFVTTNDYENPFTKGISNYYYPVSSNSFSDSTLFLRNIEIRSDIGLLNDNTQVINGFTHDNFQTKLIVYPNTKFTNLSIELINIKEVYFRSYMKLQNLMALVGGFISFIKLALHASLFKFYENSYFLGLMNLFFNYNEEKSIKIIKGNNLVEQSKDISKTCTNNFINMNNTNPITIKKFNLRNNKITLNSFEKSFGTLLCGLFCKKRVNKYNYFDLTVKSLKSKLDVTSIIRTEIDIAKLRYLTMTNDQNKVFNLLDKINISNNQEYNKFITNPYIVEDNINTCEPYDELTKKMINIIT